MARKRLPPMPAPAHASGAEILRPRAVAELCGIGMTTLHSLRRDGQFPPPLRLARRSIGWPRAEIERWIADRPRAELEGTDGDG